MKIFATSTLLALALGFATSQSAYAQEDDRNQNQRRRASEPSDRQQQRERDSYDADPYDQDSDPRQRRDRNQQRADRGQSDQRGDYGEYREYDRRNESNQRGEYERRDQRRQSSQRGERSADQSREGYVTGEVVNTKRVDVRGRDQQRLVVLLKTQRGDRVPVDLGIVSRLGQNEPQIGDWVRVRGRIVRIRDRAVLVSSQLQGQGRQVVQIDQRELGSRDNRRSQQANNRADRPNQSTTPQSRAGLGVMLTPDETGNGVRVVRVLRDSPADRAGIRPGDAIIQMDNNRISSPQDLMRAVMQKNPGEHVNLSVKRNGQRRQINTRLTSRENALQPAQEDQNRNQRGQNRNQR